MVRWLVIAFAAGISLGVMVARGFSADWVEAVGTWVGALATIATIVWAVHSFQQETRHRLEDRGRETEDKLNQERALAEAVSVRCSGGAADNYGPSTSTLVTVWVKLINGAELPATIVSFELPDVPLNQDPMRVLPQILSPGETFRDSIEVSRGMVQVKNSETGDQNPLTDYIPILVYRIGGVTWQRVGDRPPTRR